MGKKKEDSLSSSKNKGTKKIKEEAKDKPDQSQKKKHSRKKPPARLKFYNVSPNWNAISKQIEKPKKTKTPKNEKSQHMIGKSTSLYSDPSTFPTTLQKTRLKEKEKEKEKEELTGKPSELVFLSEDDPSYSEPTKTLVGCIETTMRGGFPEAYEVLIMNYHGCVLYHKFIKENIPSKLKDQHGVAKQSIDFKKLRDDLYALFKKRIVVVYKADVFFNVLMVIHPKRAQKSIVDLFRTEEDSSPTLEELAEEYELQVNRGGKKTEPSLDERAKVMLQLYRLKGAEFKAMKAAQKEDEDEEDSD